MLFQVFKKEREMYLICEATEFLREFDNLQPVDIMAQAMELSLIPRDSNNNNDILSQAMDIADIS